MDDLPDPLDLMDDGMLDGSAGGDTVPVQEIKGFLLKKSPNRLRVNRWQRRWFVLDGEALSWWERPEHEEGGKPALGAAPMSDAAVVPDGHSQKGSMDFTLSFMDGKAGQFRDLPLRAETLEEKESWVSALSRAASGLALTDSVERIAFTDADEPEPEDGQTYGAGAEIAYGDLVLGVHLGKGVCSECKRASLPGIDVALVAKTLHNFEASDRLFKEFGRLVHAMRCVPLQEESSKYQALAVAPTDVGCMQHVRSNLPEHRHVLNFVGACTSPPDLCIVTEAQPASLATVLHVQLPAPDIRQRARMGLDSTTRHPLHNSAPLACQSSG
jgi:hypothetical protein